MATTRVRQSPDEVSSVNGLSPTWALRKSSDGAGFGDPRAKEWAPNGNDARHVVILQGGFNSGKTGTVTYELVPEGGQTRLVVTHAGITSPTGFQDFGAGWNSHMTVLQERLAGRSIRDFWELHMRSREAVKNALG